MLQLLDELSDLVYVSDINNYDLLFLNKSGKKEFGIQGDLTGLKCYRVLQDRDAPCEFCTNAKLRHDEFYSWEYANPKLRHHFLLKDKLLDWEGRDARIEIAFDVTEQNNNNLALQFSLDAEIAVLECVKELHDTHDVSAAIDDILKKTGSFLNADRAYIFMIENGRMSNTFEWCAPGVKPQIKELQNLDAKLIDPWLPHFDSHKCYILPDLEKVKETSAKEYANLHSQGIHSLVAAPLELGKSLIGYIGVDNPPANTIERIAPLFNTLAYFLVSSLNRAKNEKMLLKLSYFDALTGLYNRNRFNHDLDNMDDGVFGLLGIVFIDINGLKRINDQFGRGFGDQILKEATGLIRSVFPDADSYRVGGDEFVVICTNVLKHEFEEQVRELKNLFRLSRSCHAAVGFQWAAGADAQNLLSRADEMMYEDKRDFYRKNPLTGRYRFESDDVLGLSSAQNLEKALEQRRFLIYFQPKVSIENRTLIGAEALVRYLAPNGLVVPPDQFIPALEETRLIGRLDFYVFESVCRQIARWKDGEKAMAPVSVNFSRLTLLERTFLTRLTEIWRKYDIPIKMVEIEITESMDGPDADYILQVMRKLRENGFSVSIDDFGVKYANLSLFVASDFDVLKIDKSLLYNLKDNEKSQVIIQAVTQICKKTNTKVIVEGVETEQQYEILREIGCDGAQGYLFGRPLPLSEFEKEPLWLALSVQNV